MIKGGLLQTQGRGRQSLDGREITAKEWVLALVISNKIGQGGKALGFGESVSSKVATAMATIESAVAGQTLPPDMVLARHFYDKVSQPSMICRTRYALGQHHLLTQDSLRFEFGIFFLCRSMQSCQQSPRNPSSRRW